MYVRLVGVQPSSTAAAGKRQATPRSDPSPSIRRASRQRHKKNPPLSRGHRSLACVWRSVLLLLFSGLVFGWAIPPYRTHAFFESLACWLLPSGPFRPRLVLYKQWPCQSPRHAVRYDMLYLGRGSSVTQCPLCDLFTWLRTLSRVAAEGPDRSAGRVVSRSSTCLRPERSPPNSLAGLKPLNALSNFRLIGV